MQKILVILGPTATGKSELGVELSKKFDGEIISADSRQVYRGLDIGTGKITEKEMRGIPHFLLDITDPNKNFSVMRYKKLAEEAICTIYRTKKVPIIVGGTGFYIQAVVDNVVPPEVPPDEKLRAELEQIGAPKLLEKLLRLDPNRAETIEPNNKRRLIRAIEIAKTLGSVPKQQEPNPKYEALQIGLDLPDDELRENIRVRVQERLENGWVKEVEKLLTTGVPEARLREFGLGYALIAEELSQHSNILENVRMSELEEKITATEWQYAKRQRRWYKRDKRIKWFNPKETKEITNKVAQFLKETSV